MGTTGSVYHSASDNADDPSGAGANHGDRVIADALANWARKDWGIDKSDDTKKAELSGNKAPQGSFLYRRQLAREKDKKAAW
jgi:hypothetical protein